MRWRRRGGGSGRRWAACTSWADIAQVWAQAVTMTLFEQGSPVLGGGYRVMGVGNTSSSRDGRESKQLPIWIGARGVGAAEECD